MTDQAVDVIGADRNGPFLITCDHATNRVPDWIGPAGLGLPPEDMTRHIAYDPGAEGVTRHLAALLDAPAVLSRFSRLVIDPNRGEDDPTLIMQLYDGTIIPGNRKLSATDLARRVTELYRPYHDAIDALLTAQPRLYIAIHSFTPQLLGHPPRPWHITVLSAEDRRLADLVMAELSKETDLISAANEPYAGDLRGDSVEAHALGRGLPNALIEIRNDLIETEAQQRAWAERLAPILDRAYRNGLDMWPGLSAEHIA